MEIFVQSRLAIIMDPIEEIIVKKDSTFAMMLAAQRREWEIVTILQEHVFYRDHVMALGRVTRVNDDQNDWYTCGEPELVSLVDFDLVMMRKDPPFNQEYIYTTYLLDHVSAAGTPVVNAPQALRDMNEKFAITFFPECCPATLVTRDLAILKAFCHEQDNVICKPLDTMGGKEVFHVQANDKNLNVILETLTHQGRRTIMAQRYIEAIEHGDKRIILINGQAVPHVLLRVPQAGEFRGNLAQGAQAIAGDFTQRDEEICQHIGEKLKEMGLVFVGIDIIGDYLTEINVTSPTGIREIDRLFATDVAEILFDELEDILSH